MDKTLEVIVTASVALMVALILFFLVSDNAGMFGDSTNKQTDRANCDYLRGQWSKEKGFGSCGKARDYWKEAENAPNCDPSVASWGERCGSGGA